MTKQKKFLKELQELCGKYDTNIIAPPTKKGKFKPFKVFTGDTEPESEKSIEICYIGKNTLY
ncbi:hypothetical protein [Flavobacterium sp. JP2137]|uniref:hypothetical protein n=1 Tax=Flavobacterium sp. JP2137 TaxID=3414510 RepID=UPI003D2FCE21